MNIRHHMQMLTSKNVHVRYSVARHDACAKAPTPPLRDHSVNCDSSSPGQIECRSHMAGAWPWTQHTHGWRICGAWTCITRALLRGKRGMHSRLSRSGMRREACHDSVNAIFDRISAAASSISNAVMVLSYDLCHARQGRGRGWVGW